MNRAQQQEGAVERAIVDLIIENGWPVVLDCLQGAALGDAACDDDAGNRGRSACLKALAQSLSQHSDALKEPQVSWEVCAYSASGQSVSRGRYETLADAEAEQRRWEATGPGRRATIEATP